MHTTHRHEVTTEACMIFLQPLSLAWRPQRRSAACLVVPEGSEHKIHLNEDGAKGQEAPHECNDPWPQIPVACRDW